MSHGRDRPPLLHRYQMVPLPRSPDDLAQTVRDAYRQADTLSTQFQAYSATGLGQDVRRERDMPFKLQVFTDALAPVVGSLPPDEQRHLLHLVTVLITPARAWCTAHART